MYRLIYTVLLAAAVPLSAQTITAAPAKPNIIFILADDLGYGDVGCYGQEKIRTPRLDRMAAEGLRFTQFYSGATVCAPSRCTLMTGMHNGHAAVRGNKEVQPEGQAPMPAGTLTVARFLKNAGYETALIGKWGLGFPGSDSEPLKAGFDYFFGHNCQRYAHWYYPEHLWRNEQKVELPGNKDGGRAQYTLDLFEADALKYLDEHHDKPFFLYLALTTPHAELLVPEDSMAPYTGKWPEKPYAGGKGGAGAAGSAIGAYHSSPTPHAAFAGMVSRMDRTVGRVLDRLQELRIAERTLVIFASDNGPHKEGGGDPDFFRSAGPFRGYKRDLYEGGIRVPFLAWWPGTIKPRQESSHVGYFGDFFATAADLAGARTPSGLDSISFAPTLFGRTGAQKQHDYLYFEFYEGAGGRAVRWNDWKAVLPGWQAPVELYYLSKDPGERDNLALQHPDLVEKAKTLMNAAHLPSPAWPEARKQTGP